MKKFNYKLLNNYKIHGQNVEQSIRFRLTGKIEKADNVPHSVQGDCLNYQIKSARATVCNGTNLEGYLKADAATAYIYGAKNGTAYILTPDEYKAFCYKFGTVDRESTKNGGREKIRLGWESQKMIEWLEQTTK